MPDNPANIIRTSIEDELRKSYLDYAMSVIAGRALPDVRDGLKPVHRRILYAMSQLSNNWNSPYKKSARIVGDVIGRYHPHGDSAVYDAIVRMAQPFSLRYMLVQGQGNFGSLDGDSPAAMRYTEIRMQRFAHELLADLDKDTVNFSPNYDGNETMPDVMPTRIPNLLVNGSSGIAVGMATNIPPHHLGEVVDATLALLQNPDLEVDDLLVHIHGPDFPTGGIINGRSGLIQAYHTGRGRAVMRARAEVESVGKNRERIVVNEIPFQLNKATLIEKIALLVRDKQLEGISELRDESNKDGVRIVIEVKSGANGEVVLNNLYSQTAMQSTFGINTVALVGGQPQTLNLKQILAEFIQHRREVVIRRSQYLLRQARQKGHVLEGHAIAISNLDEVLDLVRASENRAKAEEALQARTWPADMVLEMLGDADPCVPEDLDEESGIVPAASDKKKGKKDQPMYQLSSVQARAITDLRLHRLTAMERGSLIDQYREILQQIRELLDILGRSERLNEVIRDELQEIKDQYTDERRTEIMDSEEDFEEEDLIPEEEVVVTITRSGYAKRQSLDVYQAQRRGGVGKAAATVRDDDDFVSQMLVTSTHDSLLYFTNRGRVFSLKAFRIPDATRTARGRPLINMLALGENEQVTNIMPIRDFNQPLHIVMATRAGYIKKTALEHFSRLRRSGLIALKLGEGDALIGAALASDDDEIMLFSSVGKAVRFRGNTVRSMGRAARGVRGIRLDKNQQAISLLIPAPDASILIVSSTGQGKRTRESEFPLKGRATKGVIAMKLKDSTLVGATLTDESDGVMFITDNGRLIRTRVNEISEYSRNTQGVRVVRLKDGEALSSVARITEDEDDENLSGEGSNLEPDAENLESDADDQPPEPEGD